jgi:hypothetical protein
MAAAGSMATAGGGISSRSGSVVFFVLMVAVRVWPLSLRPHWAAATRYTGSAPRHPSNRGRAFRPGGGAGATRVNAVSGYPGGPPAAPRDATISCHRAATLTAPAMSGHQG